MDLKSHDTRFQPSNISNLRKVSEQWLENLAKSWKPENVTRVACSIQPKVFEVEVVARKPLPILGGDKEGVKKPSRKMTPCPPMRGTVGK
jgi:hypothetical protein